MTIINYYITSKTGYDRFKLNRCLLCSSAASSVQKRMGKILWELLWEWIPIGLTNHNFIK